MAELKLNLNCLFKVYSAKGGIAGKGMKISHSDNGFSGLKKNTGFTLLEIMVSVAVMAIVFVSVFRMQSASIDLAAAGRFHTLAPMLAEKVLSQVEQSLSEGMETQGNFGQDYPGIQWEFELEDADFEGMAGINPDSEFRLKKISLKISRPDSSDLFSVETWRVVDE